MAKQEKLTVTILKKRLDVLLRSIRYMGSEDGIHNVCATCKKEFLISELQCGHFIKRGNMVLKYEPRNMMPQCRRCNHFLDGAQDKAAKFVIDVHGLDCFNDFIETDYKWLNGELKTIGKKEYVEYYNLWLNATRAIEKKFDIKIIPGTWEPVTL